jgi:hypothetical protein
VETVRGRYRIPKFSILMMLGIFASVSAASAQNSLDWTAPFPPFHIADNLYYVGSKGLANYLITTPQGHILINSDLEANIPLTRPAQRSSASSSAASSSS